MSEEITKEIFDVLLYISRIDVSGDEKVLLQNQISRIVGYFAELERFKNDSIELSDCNSNSEKNLRTLLLPSYIESRALKLISSEFMDGYFRTPKVLTSS